MPVTPDELYAVLHTLEIDYPLHQHPPLHTVAESRGLRGEIPGAHCKSLFSEEPQGSLHLVALPKIQIGSSKIKRKSSKPVSEAELKAIHTQSRDLERTGKRLI